ncbi:hypothetical protein BOTBODRAFT_63004 [Botryobasidium botryosum FD-172 SS1]|uniref:HTH La-type RNA-binding domain-containing protein n=1 Tax=Botryobasidium botryosum (strain FD-172 SS1) TaxID=930990 RepID=A0A067N4U5_BOTB1|nr:hypothetical protein BOTBODRAFT_63004 [Botryobasidium botryosum FD-172 SS1]
MDVVMTDAEPPVDGELASKALAQVEFYFSDSNILTDAAFRNLYNAYKTHWVSIATIASFNRMNQFRAFGLPWLADVLRTSKSLLQVDGKGGSVRRTSPVATTLSDLISRSIFADGFGEETDNMLDHILAFFAPYGKVSSIRLHRTVDRPKKFMGSVFCEFERIESVKAFLSAEPAPAWNGRELVIMPREESHLNDSSAEEERYRIQREKGKMVVKKPIHEPDVQKVLDIAEEYLSDSGLPLYHAAWHLYLADKAEHWIPIDKFAALRNFEEFASRGTEWFAEVLRKSETLLEVDERGERVRRRARILHQVGQLECSVYAAGFDRGSKDIQYELEGFFRLYGRVEAVTLRLDAKGRFTGSAYCQFSRLAGVERFLNANPAPEWHGKKLITMSKTDYCKARMFEENLVSQAIVKEFALKEKVAMWDRCVLWNYRKQLLAEQLANKPIKPAFSVEFCTSTIDVELDGTICFIEDVTWEDKCTLRFSCVEPSPPLNWQNNWDTLKLPLRPHFPFISHIKKFTPTQGTIGVSRRVTEEDLQLVRKICSTVLGRAVTWSRPSDEEEKAHMLEWATRHAKFVAKVLSGEKPPKKSKKKKKGAKKEPARLRRRLRGMGGLAPANA